METLVSSFPMSPAPMWQPAPTGRSPATAANVSDLVASLQQRLSLSRAHLREWVAAEKAVYDGATSRYRADRSVYQDQVDLKIQSALAWQIERGLSLQERPATASSPLERQALLEQQDALQTTNESLKAAVLSSSKRLKEMEAELRQMKDQATRDGGAEINRPSFEPVQQKLTDLQSVLQGYQEVSGLSFEKAENARLRFTFRGLYVGNPEQCFSFLLSTTDDDLYIVEECEPAVADEDLTGLLEELNSTEDLGAFIRQMRRLGERALA